MTETPPSPDTDLLTSVAALLQESGHNASDLEFVDNLPKSARCFLFNNKTMVAHYRRDGTVHIESALILNSCHR